VLNHKQAKNIFLALLVHLGTMRLTQLCIWLWTLYILLILSSYLHATGYKNLF